MITASKIKEKVESYDLSKPHHAQFRLCIRSENFAEQYKLVFKEITEELESNPQDFYDRARSFVRNHKEINFALTKMRTGSTVVHEDQNVAVRPALERIAKFWEASPALRFYAFYLSGRKAPYEKLKSPEVVLKYFKGLGLSSGELNTIRKLRHAIYHPGEFKNGLVLSDKGEPICKLSEVLELEEKIDDVNHWVIMMTLYLIIHNPQFTLTVISLLNYEYFNKKELYVDSLWPVYKLLGSSASRPEQEPKQQQPKLAQWITKVYPFVKSPRQAFMGYALVNGIVRKISGDFSKAYNRSDVVHLLNTFRDKSLEATNLLRQSATVFTDQESHAAFIQLATAIERDALRQTDLNRTTDQNTVDYIVSILNEKFTREQP
jgi:hypothetical protein